MCPVDQNDKTQKRWTNSLPSTPTTAGAEKHPLGNESLHSHAEKEQQKNREPFNERSAKTPVSGRPTKEHLGPLSLLNILTATKETKVRTVGGGPLRTTHKRNLIYSSKQRSTYSLTLEANSFAIFEKKSNKTWTNTAYIDNTPFAPTGRAGLDKVNSRCVFGMADECLLSNASS